MDWAARTPTISPGLTAARRKRFSRSPSTLSSASLVRLCCNTRRLKASLERRRALTRSVASFWACLDKSSSPRMTTRRSNASLILGMASAGCKSLRPPRLILNLVFAVSIMRVILSGSCRFSSASRTLRRIKSRSTCIAWNSSSRCR